MLSRDVMRIFLDANVIFSAANPDSHLNRLVRYLADHHTPISSDYAREEAFRNICAKRPDWLDGYHNLLSGLEIVRSVDRSVGAAKRGHCLNLDKIASSRG
jgi:hypothetical protein